MAKKKPPWEKASELAEAVVRRAKEANNLEAMLTSMLATNYTDDPARFDADWEKLFGDAEELPVSENVDGIMETLQRLGAEIEKDEGGQVSSVILHGARVADEDMESVKGLQTLQKLYLKSTRISDIGVEHLAELKQLNELNLGGTNVTDEGLTHLKTMENLTMLYLDLTQITDSGLEQLRELPQLRCLDLRKSKVTQEGVDAFKESRPGCDVAY